MYVHNRSRMRWEGPRETLKASATTLAQKSRNAPTKTQSRGSMDRVRLLASPSQFKKKGRDAK
jgi:hypothetical protein